MCMCTGFAVTNYLIVTNDHCVPALNLGDKTTFRSFFGQDVEAELIGKSSIDGVGTDIHGRDYDPISKGDVALLRTKQRMDLTPVKLGDSDLLQQYDPVLSVGHPAIMARTGPFVTTVGHVLGHNVQYPKNLQYQLPAHKGASGSGVFNLDGEVIGQVANGGHYYQGEIQTLLITQYGRRALTIDHDPFFLNLNPIPFEVSPYVPIARGHSTGGAPSNYIRQLVEQWAPGELAGGTSSAVSAMDATGVAGFVDIRPSQGATEDQDSPSALERSVCDVTPDTAMDTPSLAVITVPLLDPMYEAATKCVKAFGVMVIANREGPEIPDRALQHAAAVTAEYLDNDGDGSVDDPPVNGALVESNAAVLLVNDQRDDEGLFQTRFGNANDIKHAMLSVYEIPPHQGKGYGGNFYDSSLEEIFHLITDIGYATVYDDLNPEGNSKLTAAMDVARGGRFIEVPEQYPDDAWLTYNDAGCAYKCQASEYLHWLLSSVLGAQAHRCDAIAENWKLCTREQVEETDTAGFALVTNPDYNLPTVLPDGGYPNVAYLTTTHATDRPDLTPKLIPVGDPLHGLLHKYVNVFGMSILAFEGYPDEMLSHVATITAEYLDNNEDGQVDNPAVNAAIAQNHGTVVLVTVDGDGGLTEWFAVRDRPALEYIREVVLIGMHANKGGTQCGPECGELPDSALEHVPEVMQTAGYAKVYDDLRSEEGSRLALAIDAAKGGATRDVPDSYPDGAWYTPDYRYEEQFVEYFYHGLGTSLGLYGDTSPGVCADYAAEWKVCTRAELETTDTRMWALLTDEQYKLPTIAPDGVYAAPTNRWIEEGIRLDNDRMGYTGVIAD
ncbi:MAG: serine protease, partial [Vicinamibacterales bacterium]